MWVATSRSYRLYDVEREVKDIVLSYVQSMRSNMRIVINDLLVEKYNSEYSAQIALVGGLDGVGVMVRIGANNG